MAAHFYFYCSRNSNFHLCEWPSDDAIADGVAWAYNFTIVMKTDHIINLLYIIVSILPMVLI